MPTPDRATPLLAILMAMPLSTPAMAGLPVHTLDNGTVRAGVTEAIGGRLLSFALAGQPNFLRVDEAAGDPAAAVDANTGNVAYYGHEVWAGPQQQWWCTRTSIRHARPPRRCGRPIPT